jgi:hypothetical protein
MSNRTYDPREGNQQPNNRLQPTTAGAIMSRRA